MVELDGALVMQVVADSLNELQRLQDRSKDRALAKELAISNSKKRRDRRRGEIKSGTVRKPPKLQDLRKSAHEKQRLWSIGPIRVSSPGSVCRLACLSRCAKQSTRGLELY
eukprot:COSAG01_NODE_5397_length_4289_cov_8.059427_5_plen_111_part_00